MSKWEDGGCSRSSSKAFFAVVISCKTPCKLKPKLLEILPFLFCTCVSGVEDVVIGNGHLEEEPKNVSVELSTLQPHMG